MRDYIGARVDPPVAAGGLAALPGLNEGMQVLLLQPPWIGVGSLDPEIALRTREPQPPGPNGTAVDSRSRQRRSHRPVGGPVFLAFAVTRGFVTQKPEAVACSRDMAMGASREMSETRLLRLAAGDGS